MEIVADCNDQSEIAMGWHAYLQDTLTFPFNAKCRLRRAISPLEVGEAVEAGLAGAKPLSGNGYKVALLKRLMVRAVEMTR